MKPQFFVDRDSQDQANIVAVYPDGVFYLHYTAGGRLEAAQRMVSSNGPLTGVPCNPFVTHHCPWVDTARFPQDSPALTGDLEAVPDYADAHPYNTPQP